ncbi:competence type IV pilus minor pilin ComGF [Halobacillus litoralis]|uniref:competence type IV pilus minor pilin ComGF n=1 Tax=Halobacillus litoralis TaxID=45668 RepID=UPI002493CAFE|nr:competence type IV pilus minor pilin ComGF [Halobacillus litoralis]
MRLMKNERGFTLSEVMISLTLTMIILSLSTPLLSLIHTKNFYYEEMAVQQLGAFIQEEINRSRNYSIFPNAITVIDKNHRNVLIEQYGAIIKRSVDGSGHESLLQDVQSFKIDTSPQTITMEVMMKSEKVYKRTIHLPH